MNFKDFHPKIKVNTIVDKYIKITKIVRIKANTETNRPIIKTPLYLDNYAIKYRRNEQLKKKYTTYIFHSQKNVNLYFNHEQNEILSKGNEWFRYAA